MFYATVDLGGTKIACGLGDQNGNILAETTYPTQSHEGPAAVLDRIASIIRLMGEPAALGMGVPGLCDTALGVTRFLPNMPGQWRDVPVAEILSHALHCPVYLLNDARLATLGELQYGWGREANSMVLFTVGTGIGGGVVIDGKLRLGALGAAGEVGHQTIVPNGPRCGCGNLGCLEALASGPAITAAGARLLLSGLSPKLHELTAGHLSRLTPALMGEAAIAGDHSVREVLEQAGEYLGIAVANVVTTLHPSMVVIGGGVAALGDAILEPIRRTVYQRVRMFPAEGVRIERSALGEKAGLLGGLALAASAGNMTNREKSWSATPI
ncbi:MAG: ROK family protein [Bryobacteraceae bacterium]|nr:ROK family protein [Bryobacteraceae bacterium]